MIETQKPNIERREVPSDVLEEVSCESCGHCLFEPVVIMQRIPALASPDGEDKLVDHQVLACKKCGHINKEVKDKLKVFISVAPLTTAQKSIEERIERERDKDE